MQYKSLPGTVHHMAGFIDHFIEQCGGHLSATEALGVYTIDFVKLAVHNLNLELKDVAVLIQSESSSIWVYIFEKEKARLHAFIATEEELLNPPTHSHQLLEKVHLCDEWIPRSYNTYGARINYYDFCCGSVEEFHNIIQSCINS